MVDQTPLPTTSQDTGPLDWRIAITDSGGRPTPEFQRRWNTQRNNNDKIGSTVGHGAPTGVPASDGLVYVDQDTTPATEYVSVGGNWVQVSAIKFTDLEDAPHSYTSKGNNLVKVNSGATGLEFATESAVLDLIGSTRGDVLFRGASAWSALTPGTSLQYLASGGSGADPHWVTLPSGSGTVTSVALTAPSMFSVTGSPITTAGTLALSLATQNPNLIFAGPVSGSAALPTFRSIDPSDLPLATTGAFGAVKPDGITITIAGGVITSVGGGGSSGVTSYFGTGAPSTLHNSGDLYFDTTSVPYVAYVQRNISNPAPTIDGTATGQWSSTTSGSATLTTTNTKDIIIAVVVWEVNNTTMPTLTSVTASGLTFTKRSGVLNNGASTPKTAMEVWWAPSTLALTGTTITATLSSACDDAVIAVYGVSGAGSLTTPFDTNVSVPATGIAASGNVPLTYSTSQTNSLAIWAEGGLGGGLTSDPTGWTTTTSILNSGGALFAGVFAAHLATSTPVVGGSVTGGTSIGGLRVGTVDAISSLSSGWFLVAPGYSTGTWTPAFGGDATNPTVTYSRQSGTYTQIGNQVFCEGELVISTLSGGSGDLIITGLPITPSSPRFVGGSNVDFAIGFTPTAPSGGYIIAATPEVFLTNISGSGTVNTPVSSLTTATQIVFRVVYKI